MLFYISKTNQYQDMLVAEEQNMNNADIQRDLKEEFLREVQYSSYSNSCYAEFIEKFLDNPKFSNVLTKKVEHQNLSEIETILFNSITKHLKLLREFELFGKQKYRQEYAMRIASSLTQIEQQLEFNSRNEKNVIRTLEEIRLIEEILYYNHLTFEQKNYIACRVEAIVDARENVLRRAETHDHYLIEQVLEALKIPSLTIRFIKYIVEYEIKYYDASIENTEYRLAFENSKLVEKFEEFKIAHEFIFLTTPSELFTEIITLLKAYRNANKEEDYYYSLFNQLYFFPNLSYSQYVECHCNYDCDCFNEGAIKEFEKEKEEAYKEIKIQMQKYKKAKKHWSKIKKQFEALIKQLSKPYQEEENM